MEKISISPEAVARFAQFREDVNQKVADTRYLEVIESTSDRMTLTTLKLAALLTMHDRRSRIEELDLLQAIAYAGRWFDNTVTVASMISESEWLREVNKLEKFIESQGGKVSYAKAYDAFPDMKYRDFDDMVTALENRRMIRRSRVGAQWHLEVDEGGD